ncbi:MAG: KH domain-containing protein [Anaerosomatales bacterium]|nr:KH domain-containing protein [Anaerosomatales bacterium]
MPSSVDIDGLVSYLISSLVDHPEDVRITKRDGEHGIVYEVATNPEDTGKVIGRQGRVIKAVRTLVRAAASLAGTDATVEVLD